MAKSKPDEKRAAAAFQTFGTNGQVTLPVGMILVVVVVVVGVVVGGLVAGAVPSMHDGSWVHRPLLWHVIRLKAGFSK